MLIDAGLSHGTRAVALRHTAVFAVSKAGTMGAARFASAKADAFTLSEC